MEASKTDPPVVDSKWTIYQFFSIIFCWVQNPISDLKPTVKTTDYIKSILKWILSRLLFHFKARFDQVVLTRCRIGPSRRTHFC